MEMKCALVFLFSLVTFVSPTLSFEDPSDGNLDEDFEVFASGVTENDVTFHFYTPEKPSGQAIKRSQLHDIVRLTNFDVSRETLVVIHGWLNNNESAINDEIKTAAQRSGRNINIIVVDWSKISRSGYTKAQGSVLKVGNYVGDFLLELRNNLNKSLDKITIVGHSLGAHVAGNTGARTGGLIDTIVGLDPAGPLFFKSRTNNRLDPTDAKFVHVIHTNDGLLGFGIVMGHVDVYPNGGSVQAGCALDLTGMCSHMRAFKLYAESLLNNKFVAWECGSMLKFRWGRCWKNPTTRMGGFPVDKSASGEFWLYTNRRSPYGQGTDPNDETGDDPDPNM